MKTELPIRTKTTHSPRLHHSRPTRVRGLVGLGVMASLLLHAVPLRAADWKGPDGIGGSGAWLNTNFAPTGTPTSSVHVVFNLSEVYTATHADVTIAGAASARSLTVQNGKSVTLKLADAASLTVGNGVINVGGVIANTPAASSSLLQIEGPATGSATLNAMRLYIEGNIINVGTGHRNALILSGENLTVNLTGTYSAAGSGSSITLTDGITVNTAPATLNYKSDSGAFYVRAGNTGAIYDNRITIEDGTLSASYFRVQGLLQVGADGVLEASPSAPDGNLLIEVNRLGNGAGGRFEAEGNGMDASVTIDVLEMATFAVGLSDPLTGTRTEAGSLQLGSHLKFQTSSTLELGIFGAGENDQIMIGPDGWLENIGTGARLVLNLDGSYTPEYGESWTLFDVDPTSVNGITGNFDLSLIDQTQWDLSDFNQAGGWTVTAIPEPGTLPLLGIVAAAWIAIRKRSKAVVA